MDREWRSSWRIDSMVEPSRVENWGEEEEVVVPDGGDGVFAMVEYHTLYFVKNQESECNVMRGSILRAGT